MREYAKLKPFRVAKNQLSQQLLEHQVEIVYFSKFAVTEPKKLENIILPYIKIILLQHGLCQITMNNRKQTISDGDIVVIPSFTMHSAVVQGASTSYELFFNFLPAIKEAKLLSALKLEDAVIFRGMLSQTLAETTENTYLFFEKSLAGSYAMIDSLLKEVLITCYNEHGNILKPTAQNIREKMVVDQLMAYFCENLSESITVTKVCEHLNLSQSYLYRCTKNIMRCSPIELINHYKMYHAQQLLKDFDLSVSEVASRLGYSSVYYFSNAFKKFFKISPKKYREALHKNGA